MTILTTLPIHTQLFVAFVALLTLYFHVRYSEATIVYGPTVLTTTGIFATFVGIAIGLSEFNSADVQQSVPELIGGLKTAFWGSIAGVGGALTIKFRQLFLGNPRTLAGSGDDGQITASDLATLLNNIQQALVGPGQSSLIAQLRLGQTESNERLDGLKKAQLDALEKLSELGSKTLIEALQNVIRDFNQKLTEQFGENFKELNEAVAKLLVWQAQYKRQVEETTMQMSIAATAMTTSTEQYRSLVSKAEVFSKVSKDLSSLLAGLETQRTELGTSLKQLGQLLTAASGSLPAIETKLLELTRQLTSAVTQNQTEVNKALLENTLLIRGSIEASTKNITSLNAEVSREIANVIARTREQIAVLDAALAEELQKSLESLGRQLAALSEKFVSDYGPLTDKLQLLVQSSRRAP